MLIGYARVLPLDQTLTLQHDALRAAGCTRFFSDTRRSTRKRRSGLEEALSYLRTGDTLVVWRLDCLGRSLKHLVDTVQELEHQGVGFKSLMEQLDTTTPAGTVVLQVFGALAQFERALLVERTQTGMSAARVGGGQASQAGRPRGTTRFNPQKLALAQYLAADPHRSITEICRTLGISRTTYYRHMDSAPASVGQGMGSNEQPRRHRISQPKSVTGPSSKAQHEM